MTAPNSLRQAASTKVLLTVVVLTLVSCSHLPERIEEDASFNRCYTLTATDELPDELLAASLPAAPIPLSVADLARFATIGIPQTLSWRGTYQLAPEPAVISPDGNRAAVVVRRGDPRTGANEACLLVYRLDLPLEQHRPKVLVGFQSQSNFQPIALVGWQSEGRSLVFAATDGTNPSQVYRADIATGAVTPLTRLTDQLVWFDISRDGDRLVTIQEPSGDPDHRRCVLGCLADNASNEERRTALHSHDLRTGDEVTISLLNVQDQAIDFCDASGDGPISPDGRYIFRLCRLRSDAIPKWWGDYEIVPSWRDCVRRQNARCWRRSVLIDLETGRQTIWTDAPAFPFFFSLTPEAPKPIWIDNGARAIVARGVESLYEASATERITRSRSLAVFLIDPATGDAETIARLPSSIRDVDRAAWDQATGTLTLGVLGSGSSSPNSLHLRRAGESWSFADIHISPPPEAQVRLVIEQSLAERPRLVASRRDSDTRAAMLDPNSWLDHRAIGTTEVISFTTASGRQWIGGLYYPPDYDPAQRYPLVIQTHGFESDVFSLNGAARLFPGRALSPHGIVVLQLAESVPLNSPEMWEEARAGHEGAVRLLEARRIIDVARVGLIGWSATGSQIAYTMTHSNFDVRAAAFTDTSVWGWINYSTTSSPGYAEALFGAAPFSSGLEAWLETAPSFNLDRVRAPLLIINPVIGGTQWLGGNSDWYQGLTRLGRPVEAWTFDDLTHDVERTRTRMKINQLLVDWFAFWLADEERTEPAQFLGEDATSIAEQYRRWREFRQQQEQILGQPRPPLLDWTATPMEAEHR